VEDWQANRSLSPSDLPPGAVTVTTGDLSITIAKPAFHEFSARIEKLAVPVAIPTFLRS
jgi:hypothetical protein